MKRNSYLAVFLFPLLLTACEVVDDSPGLGSDLLIGYWIHPLYSGDILRLKRADSLKEQEYGLSFRTDHSLIERKNAGWCATPPIFYADFQGSWNRLDSIVEISVGYWGGLAEYRWKILSLDSGRLEIKQLEAKYYQEWLLNGIETDRYYQEEIFNPDNLRLYGIWKLYAVSGGIHGGGHELNFDYLEVKKYGIYGYIKDDNILEYGRILIDEQTDESLLVRLQPDAQSGQFMTDNEKYVQFYGNDTLYLASPCCDRYVYHYSRIH